LREAAAAAQHPLDLDGLDAFVCQKYTAGAIAMCHVSFASNLAS
jgi:hypothetical protein